MHSRYAQRRCSSAEVGERRKGNKGSFLQEGKRNADSSGEKASHNRTQFQSTPGASEPTCVHIQEPSHRSASSHKSSPDCRSEHPIGSSGYPKSESTCREETSHCIKVSPNRKERSSAPVSGMGAQQGRSEWGNMPFFGQGIPVLRERLSGGTGGDLMVLMVLLLLLWEGREDSWGTIMTLLFFFLL